MHACARVINLPRLSFNINRLRSPLLPALPAVCRKASRCSAMSLDRLQEDFYKYNLKCLTPEFSMDKNLARIGSVKVQDFESSKYVKPKTVLYELDGMPSRDLLLGATTVGATVVRLNRASCAGQTKRWDMIESHSSIGVILYHRAFNSFIIVRQFRPAVWATAATAATAAGLPVPPLSAGFTHELCAGLLDKAKSPLETCHEEILEECGYNAPADTIVEVTSFISSSGTAGAIHTLFFAEIDESMRVETGGGIDTERIEVLSLPLDNTEAFVLDAHLGKSPGLMFGLTWALHQIRAGKLGSGPNGQALETGALQLNSVLSA